MDVATQGKSNIVGDGDAASSLKNNRTQIVQVISRRDRGVTKHLNTLHHVVFLIDSGIVIS